MLRCACDPPQDGNPTRPVEEHRSAIQRGTPVALPAGASPIQMGPGKSDEELVCQLSE